MRSPTLLSAASFALAVAPAIAQQHQDMREEIRRIVREEVRAAVHDAIQELHGGMPAHREGDEHRDGQEGQRTERPMWRRLGPAQGEGGELRELEGEMKELESTLEKLQGEIGKRVGGQVHGLQPLLHAGQHPEESGRKVQTRKLAPGAFKVDGGEGQVFELKMDGGELHMVTPQGQKAFQFHIDGDGEAGGEKAEKAERKVKTLKLPGAFKVGGGEGETIELKLEGGEVHMVTPKGQNVFQLRLDDGDDEKGEKSEKKAGTKVESPRGMIWIQGDDQEKTEAPKIRKTTKSGKTPAAVNTITLPMVGQPVVGQPASCDCNCVVVIRCENGQCHIEGSCNGQPLTPAQSKTKAAKASKAKQAKGSDDDEDDDDDGNSSLKVEVKTNAGCCETTGKAAAGCCETTTATTGKGDCCGCCEPKKAETTKPGAKEAPKKLIN